VRTLSKAVVVALTLWGGTASAQVVSAQVTVAAPTVHFEVAPPLVYVSPGVMVVQDYDEEIFFTGGWYWCSRGGVWFRTRDYRGGWIAAPPRYVPARLVHIPPGHYRNFHGGPGHPVYRGAPGHVARAYGRPGPARGPMMARGGGAHVAGPPHGGGGGVHMAGPPHGGGGGAHMAGPPHGGGGGAHMAGPPHGGGGGGGGRGHR